jgi:pimeloyl-ACP methyl ester carboxylesterase
MSLNNVSVVVVHGAWADGSSWSKVIGPLRAEGVRVVAAPLPLTSLPDDVAALDRTLERIEGPVVLVGHAYAGAVIAATRDEKVKSLVYVAALAPDEGETVADVFYRAAPHPQAPMLAPDKHGAIWLPETAFAEDRPSWFLVAEQDRMITPDTQRFMAERMKATVRSAPVDHAPIITAPAVVVDIIRAPMRAIAPIGLPG